MSNVIAKDSELKKVFEFNLFLSGETEVTDTKFQASLKEYRRYCNLFTGRPNWSRIFGDTRKKNIGKEIGVFLCGPPAIGAALRKCCKKFSDPPEERQERPTVFVYHQENF